MFKLVALPGKRRVGWGSWGCGVGKVVNIFICADAGSPMKEVAQVRAIAGVGLEGDRYAAGKGAWSKSKPKVRHVSLISFEAIRAANRDGKPFLAQETRRNILTAGVDLNVLVGREFSVGPVQMRGTELCDPCDRPSILCGVENFRTRFVNGGGLRAEILSSGVIRREDIIRI